MVKQLRHSWLGNVSYNTFIPYALNATDTQFKLDLLLVKAIRFSNML